MMNDTVLSSKFGRLQPICEVKKPDNRKTKGKYYLCQCDCGNQKIIDKKGLVSGKVLSCGCLKKERVSKSITINEVGKRYGRLTVIKKVPSELTPKKSEAMWECKCDCGEIVYVAGSSLRDGKTISCGCYHKEKARERLYKNELGNRYGKLVVVEEVGKNSSGQIIWKCKCDCGNYINVLGTELRRGHTQSCGCLVSKGEQRIAEILQQNQIKYKSQYTNKELYTKRNGFLRFDFAIYKNNKIAYFIEYQGKQHYENTDFFEDLKYIQQRDQEKRDYCKQKNIPLIEIPYWKYNSLSLEDLLYEEEEE